LLRVVHDFVEGDVIDVVPRRFYGHMEGAVLDGRDVETVQAELGPP
jgi:phage tail protein X